jgi:hypothetical protein
MPRSSKKSPESDAEPPQEPKKPTPPTPPLQPLQIIKKGSAEAIPPKPPEALPVEAVQPVSEVKPASLESKFPTRPKPGISSPSRRPIPKAEIPVIEKATGASGDVFSVGDLVWITEPFGTLVSALIDSFYADAHGEIWARLKPEEVNPNCRWEQGCIRSEGLVKAP